jgi:DNA primase
MAGRIPQEFLDQLLSRVDIVEIIDARVALRKTGREYTACCPFHTEKTPSFTVSPGKQFYHCFGCGAHGSAISFLMDYERLSFPEAVEELARSAGIEMPRTAASGHSEHGDLIAAVEQASAFYRGCLKQHPARLRATDYLAKRGLDEETTAAFAIGYAPPGWDNLLKTMTVQGFNREDLITAGLVVQHDDGRCYDRFRDRIMFPIRDRRGRVIAFGGRVLGDAKPKYLNSAETPFFHKGRELYGLYEARTSERLLERLLVVEGYMDVVALAQAGIRNAVATLGTAATPEHLDRLFRLTRDIIFCFDGDQAGRQAAWRALENALGLLRDGRKAAFLFLPEGEDPDSLVRAEGRRAFEQRIERAMPLSDYLFHHLTSATDAETLDGRARLAEQAKPLLSRLPDSIYRDMMVERLAKITGTTESSLARHLSASAEESPQPPSDRPPHITRTPVRHAIALLLHRPELAQLIGDLHCLRTIPAPGLTLLVELIELMQNNPNLNTATVLERFRGTETGLILERLASWRPEIPDTLLERELMGALEQLEKRYDPRQRLLDKLARGMLSADEIEELRKLGGSRKDQI